MSAGGPAARTGVTICLGVPLALLSDALQSQRLDLPVCWEGAGHSPEPSTVLAHGT